MTFWDIASPFLIVVVRCPNIDLFTNMVDMGYTLLFSELVDVKHPTMSLGVFLPEGCCLRRKFLERCFHAGVVLA